MEGRDRGDASLELGEGGRVVGCRLTGGEIGTDPGELVGETGRLATGETELSVGGARRGELRADRRDPVGGGGGRGGSGLGPRLRGDTAFDDRGELARRRRNRLVEMGAEGGRIRDRRATGRAGSRLPGTDRGEPTLRRLKIALRTGMGGA